MCFQKLNTCYQKVDIFLDQQFKKMENSTTNELGIMTGKFIFLTTLSREDM